MPDTALTVVPLLSLSIAVLFHPSGLEKTPVFEDRREQAEIHFRHHASPTQEKYLIETMGGGVALFDFNNDGMLDIFFVNGGEPQDPAPAGTQVSRWEPTRSHRLYRNNGDGTFRDVTRQAGVSVLLEPNYGMGAAVGDFDNDGWMDLYVTNLGTNVLFHNRGDGTFQNITEKVGVSAGGWSASAGFFDYDNDGDLDLFVTRYLDWDFSKHIRCGTPFPTYCRPTKFPPVSNLLFRNNGDGTFTDVSDVSGIGKVLGKGLGVAFNDYNGDGFTDVCVASDLFPQLLFHNNGDGTFGEKALAAGLAFNEDGGVFSGMGIDFDDYDNDGLPDVVITNLAKEMYALYRNEGHGTLSYVTRPSHLGRVTLFMSGWGVRWTDYDHDGWKDLFVAQSHVLDNVELIDPHLRYLQAPLLARNVKGKFVDVSSQSGKVFSEPVAGRGAGFGDLDNDGDVDIVVGVLDDFPQVLYSNASEVAGHWLLVDLQGTVSNRNGFGAKIKIVADSGFSQWGYCSAAGSYLSASDKRVHFGLGSDTRVKSLEILWPSGVRQVLQHVKSDQIITAVEPRSVEAMK